MSSTPVIYRSDFIKRPKLFRVWEQYRNRPSIQYAMELFSEALGVFFYTYAGIGATAPYIIGNILKINGLGTPFQAGWGYGFGVVFALVVCAATSGGHINPCITIAFAIFRGFPVKKVPGYILAQIFGAYVASILTYNQWKVFILDAEAVLKQTGLYDQLQFTPSGPAGIFALYLPPGQTYGSVFLNEFTNCAFVALVIWACIDPTNILVPPVAAPLVIGMAYSVAIWGYAVPGIALNTARDVGARLMAITYWGPAAAGGRYAALTALTNIPATLFAICIYEIFLTDSDRVVTAAHMEHGRLNVEHRRLGKQAAQVGATSDASVKQSISEYEHARV